MPQVQRHEGVERWIYDSARAYLTKRPREGVHVSDLLSPRKAYWARVMPKPPTDREVMYFIAGRGHEEVVMALADLGRYRKVGGEWEGISYEIDAVTPTGGTIDVPVEMKTTRRPTIPEVEKALEDYALAIQQLGYYVAIQNESRPEIKVGYLVQLHLMARNLALQDDDDGETVEEADPFAWLKQSRPEARVWQIEWTAEELSAARFAMRSMKVLLELSLEAQDHTVLPPCEKWMCGQEHVKKNDPYCPRCKTVYVVGEVKADGKKRGVFKKCATCKEKGERLDLVRPQETVFVPTCRWFAQCKPSENWPQYLDSFWKPSRDAA